MRTATKTFPRPPFPSPDDFVEALNNALPHFGSIDWVNRTGSTNADLTLLAQRLRTQHPVPDRPWLLGAHLQTAGKGRAGRPWANQAGATLMFSCAFATDIPVARLPGLSPALGVSTCLALRALFRDASTEQSGLQHGEAMLQPLTLKWPNDLQWHGGKLAGLLIETAPCATVVIGLGLNLHGAQALSTHLGREIAALDDIEEHLDSILHPATVVASLAHAWQTALLAFERNGYTAFSQSFDIVDALVGQPVHVMDQGKILYQGVAQGTDSLGCLRVVTATGPVSVMVGDVSIRPVHP